MGGEGARRASWRSALSVFVSIDGRAAGALLLADELSARPAGRPRSSQCVASRACLVTGTGRCG